MQLPCKREGEQDALPQPFMLESATGPIFISDSGSAEAKRVWRNSLIPLPTFQV